MNRPLIKICGITRLEDARFCAGAMVDRLGFIFTPHSPRLVEEGLAGAIVNWLEGVETVGVFMDQDPDWILGVMRRTGLTRIQLHGEESPADIASLERRHPITKAIAVTDGMTVEELRRRIDLYAPHVDEFLFDHRVVRDGIEVRGGTGTPFDWSILRQVDIPRPWFLAGGISPATVEAAWTACRPHGFDVSSGVEHSPGIKDYEAVMELMDRVEGIS